LAALEQPVAESGAATAEILPLTGEASRRAAYRTPPGSPIDVITGDYPT